MLEADLNLGVPIFRCADLDPPMAQAVAMQVMSSRESHP